MKILFVTDIHGSNLCYRKFLNALKIYGVDVGIMLGDLTGKLLIPFVEKAGGGWQTKFLGRNLEIDTEEELAHTKKTVETCGYYWKHFEQDEFSEYKQDPERLDRLFRRLMVERMEEWMRLGEERLRGQPYKMYVAPGNDDHFEVDEVLDSSDVVINANDRVVHIGDHEMVTFAWTNPTPWDTPREKPDEELEPMLEELIAQVSDVKNAIFNFHAPPYGSSLDLAPELTEDLIQAADRKIHVGSRAVTNMIDKYQPMLGLHGHIHESRAIQNWGRTVLMNPGVAEGYPPGGVSGARGLPPGGQGVDR